MTNILEMRHVTKRFPGVLALDDVDFAVQEAEVHALIGENGAGKSTLIKIIAGVYDFEGEVLFQGDNIRFSTPKMAIDAGISVIYQELNSCDEISIAENIFCGRLPKKKNGLMVDHKALVEQSAMLLGEIGLDIDPTETLDKLTTSQKQMVEIAKAISHNAKLIIMDEPTSSLSQKEIEKLFAIIEKLRSRNISVIYVSHKLEEIFRVADRVTVFRDGRFVDTKLISDITQEQLVAMMVGREVKVLYPRTESVIGDVQLEVRGLTNERISDVSFDVRAGEIVGFSGLIGAGRTELAKAIFGFDRIVSGEVLVKGRLIPKGSTNAAKKAGIGYISEDRKNEGIFADLDIRENASITIIDALAKHMVIDRKEEMSRVTGIADTLRIKTPSLQVSPGKLSGGNQQKVIVARWLLDEGLHVLIVDEPTRGIDVGAKAEIYAILDQMAAKGMAIIIMSSEMNELLNVCDRIYVMNKGRITGCLSKDEATSEAIMQYALA